LLLFCDRSGTYDIIVGGEKVGEYVEEGSFGELALMYNVPRAATIIATSDGKLWAMVTLSCSNLTFLVLYTSSFLKFKQTNSLKLIVNLFFEIFGYGQRDLW